ncbi:hypothetical protein NicSoilB4_03490 [Arthrobacter sp. NicSoilB4]|nr:hypothetical protein NicSoilB4_03490 [Arthrobacter sp. NicSoilB4]
MVVPAKLAKATLRRVLRLGGACTPAGEVGGTEVMAISFDVSLDAWLCDLAHRNESVDIQLPPKRGSSDERGTVPAVT